MDWSKKISDLEEQGLTQEQIGRLIDCSQSYVSELKTGRRGKRLDYKIGSRLMELWQTRVSRRRATDKAGA